MSTTETSRVNRTTQEAQGWYDRLSPFYCTLAGRWEAGPRAAGLALLEAQPGEHVLEIGTGPGQDLQVLGERVGAAGCVFGVDLSRGMLAHASNRRTQAHLAQADAAHLPYAASAVDAVYMSFTLELFDTPIVPGVLGECRRVLRSGGRLVVVSMEQEQPGSWIQRLYEWSHARFPRYVDCRPAPVVAWIQTAGFQVQAVRRLRLFGLRVACVAAVR